MPVGHRFKSVLCLLAALALLCLAGTGLSQAASTTRVVQITLKASGQPSNAEMGRAVAIIRARLTQLHRQGSVTRKAGTNLIAVRLDGVTVATARKVAISVDQPAQLELYDLTPSLLYPSIDAHQNPVATPSLTALLSHATKGQTGRPSAYYLTRNARVLAGPAPRAAALLLAYGGKLPHGDRLLPVPAHATVVTCSSAFALVCPATAPGMRPAAGVTWYYLLKHGTYPAESEPQYPQLTGTQIIPGSVRAEADPTTGSPIVSFRLTPQGDRAFHALTRAEAQRGQQLGNDDYQSFAIVLDNRLYSFPTIDYTAYPNGIDPAQTGIEISGLESVQSARTLAAVLDTGALPLSFSTLIVRTIA